jgi:hypothetical protein
MRWTTSFPCTADPKWRGPPRQRVCPTPIDHVHHPRRAFTRRRRLVVAPAAWWWPGRGAPSTGRHHVFVRGLRAPAGYASGRWPATDPTSPRRVAVLLRRGASRSGRGAPGRPGRARGHRPAQGPRGGRVGGAGRGLKRHADRPPPTRPFLQPGRRAAAICWLPASARDRPAAPTGATPATTRLLGSSPGADASWSPHDGGERGHSGPGGASAIHVAWARPSSRSSGP